MRSDARLLFFLLSMGVLSSAQNNSCGGTTILNATTQLQYLTTPNYETNYKYPALLDCKFIIKAPDKCRIAIEIINLEMEPQIFDECSDFVGITPDLNEKNVSNMITICETVKHYQYISPSNSLTITFQSDELIEYRGAQLSYRYYDLFSCPPGWVELSDQNCVKLEETELDWIRAQNRCMEQQSNLLMLDSLEKTSELEGSLQSTNGSLQPFIDFFKSVPRKLWIGYTDAPSEGKLSALNSKEPKVIPGRDPETSYTDNNDANDCMTLQFGDNHPYRMDSCASYNQFICEMKKDGTSDLYPPPVDEIQDGGMVISNQHMLYILMFLIGLLILTMVSFLCFICWKKKDTRVHNETSNQQNAFMSDSSQRGEQQSHTSAQINTVPAPCASAENKTTGSRNSPVSIPIENNRPPPKRFPMAPIPNRLPFNEETSGSEKLTETGILGADDDDAPKPQPRTLPPMPAREGTFQSIKTTEGSTMRTRRNRELFERPIMNVLDNVSAISLDEFWSNKRP